MNQSFSLQRSLLFFIFTLSGVAGLIYELIWTNYLKLFLGHAAYAQTLVLMIFMGGMAIGAWIAGQTTARIKRLFLAYIIVEIFIGIAGIAFDPLFRAFLHASYTSVIPNLHQPIYIELYKWGVSSLIILPQSILLGMTFPWMSAAIMRRFPEMPGSILAMLYFTNSFGAAVGVLICGFGLIPTFGFPGTITIGALFNFLIAIFTWLCTSTPYHIVPEIPTPTTIVTFSSTDAKRNLHTLLISIAFFTGLASFMYEIGWIRLLTLVLGAATHSFELMLSSFILGIALGGLFIKFKIDQLKHPLYFLSGAQLLKGLFALLSLLAYGQAFHLMQFFMQALTRSESGYFLFNLSSYSIAMMIMLPTTFCAGITLPLITRILFVKNQNEKMIGQVYASNTIGAIVGIYLAIHWIMPLLSLKMVIVSGALVDIILGIVLCSSSVAEKKIMGMLFSSVAMIAILFFTFLFQLNPVQMASGVFRTGNANALGTVIFKKDGETSTVTVVEKNLPNQLRQLIIATNGKPDASLTIGGTSDDENTQILMGALPASVAPHATTAAVIGFGSGMSSETLLQFPNIKNVDTIDIERAMVEGAKTFLPYNKDVYGSARSQIHIQDAKIFFANTHKQYDIIVSEPSNPWVSGVASLFTDEFYEQITRHLTTHGIFCQWLQGYEINWPLIMSILKAFDAHFTYYSIYAANNGDLLILGSNDKLIATPNNFIFSIPAMKTLLHKVQVNDMQDLYIRYLASERLLHSYIVNYAVPVNSDFYPIVDLYAVQSRYMQQNVLNFGWLGFLLPFDIFNPTYPRIDAKKISLSAALMQSDLANTALLYRNAIIDPKKISTIPDQRAQWIVRTLNPESLTCITNENKTTWIQSLYSVGLLTSVYLTPDEATPLWKTIEAKACVNTLPADARNWLQLFEAINARNIAIMREKANILLLQSTNNPSQIPYLTAVAMIADLADHDTSAAQTTYALYAPKINAYFNTNPIAANQFALSLKVLHSLALKKT